MTTTAIRRALPMLLFSLLTVTPAYAQYDATFFGYAGFNGGTVTKNLFTDWHGNFAWSFNDATASASFGYGIYGCLYENNNFQGLSACMVGDVADLNWFWPDFGQGMASSYSINSISAVNGEPKLYKSTYFTNGGRVLGPNFSIQSGGNVYEFDYFGPQSLETGNYSVVLTAASASIPFGSNSNVPDLSVYFGTCDIDHTENCVYLATVNIDEFASAPQGPDWLRLPSARLAPKQLATTSLPMLKRNNFVFTANSTDAAYGLPFTRARVVTPSFVSTFYAPSSAENANP